MKSSQSFDKLFKGLNPRQREAVQALEGPVMVIAGPGTGKTKILTLRIANLLARTQTTPEAILALTFTESGATEMRRRLAEIIGVTAYRVTLATFHSFCNEIIQQYPELLGELAGAAPISEADQTALIQDLLENTEGLELLRPTGAPLLYLKPVTRALNTLKREGVSPARLAEIGQSRKVKVESAEDLHHTKGPHQSKMKGVYAEALKRAEKLSELAGVYTAYQAKLRADQLYDYNDMILEVARVLEQNQQLLLMLQEQYQYILVDEHQDTNNAQNRILELLAGFWERPNLFIVGDAKQSIYRFQGANLENFLYFKNLYKDVRLIDLTQNYRSHQAILNLAQTINPSAGAGLRAAGREKGGQIRVLALSDPDAERYTVAKEIQRLLAKKVPPEEIAVIYRDNADGQTLMSILDKLGVTYSASGDYNIFEDPQIAQLVLILEALGKYGQPGPLLTALHLPVLKIAPLDVYKLTEFCRPDKNPYDVMASRDLMKRAGISEIPRMAELSARLIDWQKQAHDQMAGQAFETIVRESGVLEGILASWQAPDKLAKLGELYDLLRNLIQRHPSYTLLNFIAHLSFIQENRIKLTSPASAPVPGRVRLMTAHKSKGLEFDHVFILGVTDEHWGPRGQRELIHLPPEIFSKATPGDLVQDEEERNLFYVAVTRARQSVTLTYARQNLEGRESLPLRFLAELKPTLVEPVNSSVRQLMFAPAKPKPADLADQEFLNQAFRRQGLSVTALNNYLECPWKYFYSNLVRIPEAPAFPLMYGNAVDRALQEYFEQFRQGTDPGRQDLIQLFHGLARRQPFQKEELAAALKRGEHSLNGWWRKYHAGFSRNILNQLKIPAVSLALGKSDEVILKGKLDRVDILDSANRVRVVDYKTGRPKSRNQIIGKTKDADGNYLRQLVFYNLLLDHYQDGKYRMQEGVLDFIDPDTRDNWHREEFVITRDQKDELAATIVQVAQEILALKFWDQTCEDKKCPYCRLRKLSL